MKEKQRTVNVIIAVEIANAGKNSRTVIPVLRAFLENWNRWEEGEKWKKRDEVDPTRISLVDSRTVNEARVKTQASSRNHPRLCYVIAAKMVLSPLFLLQRSKRRQASSPIYCRINDENRATWNDVISALSITSCNLSVFKRPDSLSLLWLIDARPWNFYNKHCIMQPEEEMRESPRTELLKYDWRCHACESMSTWTNAQYIFLNRVQFIYTVIQNASHKTILKLYLLYFVLVFQ